MMTPESPNRNPRPSQNARRKRRMFRYMAFDESSRNECASEPETCKDKLKHFLHSKPCHIAVIVLTLVDVVLVMVEIILDLKQAEKCEGEHAEESIGAKVVHYMSISILSIFLVEIFLKLIADWQHFWAHKMEIFDAFIVIVSFACDVTISFVGTEALAAVGLLIMLRLWRVVRVVNGIVMTVKDEADEKVADLEEKVERREQEIDKLKSILRNEGVEVEEELEPETGSYVTKTRVPLECAVGIEA